MTVFTAGKYEQDEPASWSEGDWDVDVRFDSGDFVAAFKDGGYEQGSRALVAVPEPTAWMLLMLGLSVIMRIKRDL